MPAETGNTIMQFLPILAIVAVFFLVMILPQRRRDKAVKTMLANMKVGDRVRTIGGVFGRIVQLKDDTVVIESGPERVQLLFARTAIATVENSEVESTEKLDTPKEEKK